MPTDKIRKYILPNIPYLFIGWAFLKLGTAYRLAAGANAGEKLLGLMQTIGVAFADFSPGLAPFDWLVGIVGAVAFRLLIYFKCWTGALCRYFREAFLPADSALEAALLSDGPAPETRPCPACGRAFLPDGRTRYCSEACAGAARRKKQRGYMRKYRG